MNKRCIICGNIIFKHTIKINNAPLCVGKLLDKDEITKDRKISIKLITCKRCKLSQLQSNNFPDPDFYDQYYMSVSYSKQMQKYQRWLAQDFIKFFNLKSKTAFEIGCGDGMFSHFLNKYGLKTIGIEPSEPFYNLARKKLKKVFNQYFNNKVPLKRNYYDAFVARQVFEHLSNPNRILKYAKLYLKPNGVGLIEVPSFSTTIKDNRYYDIFRDHVAYYTEYTLQYLLIKNNFRVIKIFHSAENEYLVAYFQNNDYYLDELKLFNKGYLNYKKEVKKLFNSYKNKKIAVWGAGGKGIALLSMCDISNKDILFVIDSDLYKQDKYTTGSHILIKSPKEINFRKLDLIIISAVMYQKEIIRELKTKYNYRKEIAILSPMPHIIKRI